MDNHPTDLITLDSANDQLQVVQDTYGYLNMEKVGLFDRKLNEIVLSISKENSAENHPVAVYKTGSKTIEMVFGNKNARESAANDGLNIFSRKVVISRPKPLKKDKAVYIYGIPVQEPVENIRKFFNDILKLKTKSEIRWLLYPGTEIRNGGRSVMVEADEETVIPGSVFYESRTTKIRKISLWYPNMPAFCRKCMSKGHLAVDCHKSFQRQFDTDFPLPQNANYAAALKNHKPPQQKKQDDEPELVLLEKREVHLRKESNETHENGEEKFFPFYTSGDILSNFYECVFDIDGVTYQSTEQYLFAERARYLNEQVTADRIMKNRAAKICKELGKGVPWTGDVHSWRDFAKEKLKLANKAKYTKHWKLRKFLFATAPATLVETNPYDHYWGIGLRKTDPSIQNPDKWKGENAMGYLLTDLREEMMKDPDMVINDKPKRPLNSPEATSHLRKRTSVSSV